MMLGAEGFPGFACQGLAAASETSRWSKTRSKSFPATQGRRTASHRGMWIEDEDHSFPPSIEEIRDLWRAQSTSPPRTRRGPLELPCRLRSLNSPRTLPTCPDWVTTTPSDTPGTPYTIKMFMTPQVSIDDYDSRELSTRSHESSIHNEVAEMDVMAKSSTSFGDLGEWSCSQTRATMSGNLGSTLDTCSYSEDRTLHSDDESPHGQKYRSLDAPFVDGKPPSSSIGSKEHLIAQCKPCAFYHKPEGCASELDCKFCHMCEAGEQRRRKVSQRTAKKIDKVRRKMCIPSCELFTLSVENLPESTTPVEFKKLMKPFGQIIRLSMKEVLRKVVSYRSLHEAEAALYATNGLTISGRTLNVYFSDSSGVPEWDYA